MLFCFRVEDRFPLSLHLSLPPQECHENRQGFPSLSSKIQMACILMVGRYCVRDAGRMSQWQCPLPSHPPQLIKEMAFSTKSFK